MSEIVSKITKKVIFLHGLEAGPKGGKVEYLKARYDTEAPDMDMSAYDIDKKHSFLNSALELIWNEGLLTPMVDYPKFRGDCVKLSLKNCCDSVRMLVMNADPGTLLIGSSWGGAVALTLIADGCWSGHTILFAPALGVVFQQTGVTESQMEAHFERIKANSTEKGYKVVVVHGDLDIVVPLKDSVRLCKAIDAELIVVPLGDHNINRYLLDQNHLEGIITRISLE